MADKRPARRVVKDGDRDIVEYHFEVKINVLASVDKTEVRKLVDAEFAKLAALLQGRKGS